MRPGNPLTTSLGEYVLVSRCSCCQGMRIQGLQVQCRTSVIRSVARGTNEAPILRHASMTVNICQHLVLFSLPPSGFARLRSVVAYSDHAVPVANSVLLLEASYQPVTTQVARAHAKLFACWSWS